MGGWERISISNIEQGMSKEEVSIHLVLLTWTFLVRYWIFPSNRQRNTVGSIECRYHTAKPLAA